MLLFTKEPRCILFFRLLSKFQKLLVLLLGETGLIFTYLWFFYFPINSALAESKIKFESTNKSLELATISTKKLSRLKSKFEKLDQDYNLMLKKYNHIHNFSDLILSTIHGRKLSCEKIFPIKHEQNDLSDDLLFSFETSGKYKNIKFLISDFSVLPIKIKNLELKEDNLGFVRLCMTAKLISLFQEKG